MNWTLLSYPHSHQKIERRQTTSSLQRAVSTIKYKNNKSYFYNLPSFWLHNVEVVTDSWYTVLSLITFVDKGENVLTVNQQ